MKLSVLDQSTAAEGGRGAQCATRRVAEAGGAVDVLLRRRARAVAAGGDHVVRGAFHEIREAPELLTGLLGLLLLTFLLIRYLLAIMPLRMVMTPRATRARRVRRRAILLFRTAAEARTQGRTGVLIYLSLDEHRAEIVADRAINEKVAPEAWGEAMAALIDAIRADRPGEGLAEAVRQVGAVLAPHFPRAHDDINELPDRLIEL